jgi:molybdopterin/thiamine biosynthesis adenylyltransferase
MRKPFASARVLIVGMGGLGCPVALALASAGVGTLGLVDDDCVELTNLHRQILFDDSMLGIPKVDAAAPSLEQFGTHVSRHPVRFVPENAIELVTNYDLVVDAADNFPTKFLIADVARKCEKAVIHASAERWSGFVFAVASQGSPCYRCLFEDIPAGPVRNCNDVGVVGAALGVLGAVQADLALRMLAGDPAAAGVLFQLDGLRLSGRTSRRSARLDCALCNGSPVAIERARYVSGEACALS